MAGPEAEGESPASADVALDGTFPAEGYEGRVRLWAAGTIRAWARA